MEGLVEMVREFGVVPGEKVLDKNGYKRIYNDALIQMVNARIRKFEAGMLGVSDFTVKGAVGFLEALRDKGVTLYLASGTDREDVVHEAEVLGYAGLFAGGIYGSVGDVSKYSKKMVLERIVSENGLAGVELAVFGDGPVELRQCRRREGIAVGVASDEVRRHSLSKAKRSRLIKAGAQIVVPDFAESHKLLELLFSAQ
jgi:phosphoglycolate phosphatase-like HAD superfamily hydrolase